MGCSQLSILYLISALAWNMLHFCDIDIHASMQFIHRSMPPKRDQNTCTKKSTVKFVSEFIKNLNTVQAVNGTNKNSIAISLDKRLVFVSLVGLFQTYKQTPMVLLYPSLFILPLKSEWIDDPTQYLDEISRTVFCQSSVFYYDAMEFAKFWRLLQWKKQQKLLFCLLDCYDDDLNEDEQKSQIAPFWWHLSHKLASMKLNGLECIFRRPKQFKSRYDCKYIEVLAELCCLQMQFKSIQEIIYQSNPDSLLPIVSYTPNQRDIGRPTTFNNSIIDGGTWYISDDYDEDEVVAS